MRALLVPLLTLSVLATLAAAARATSPVRKCGSASAGPGALVRGGSAGAQCLLHAYLEGCRPAIYELSTFGVDTIARDTFRLAAGATGCRIEVGTSLTVVPQKPHPTGNGACTSLRAAGGDVIAAGCVGGGLPASLSLTGKR